MSSVGHRRWFIASLILVAMTRVGLAETPSVMGLDDFVRLADEHHPRLAQAALSVEAARGRVDQAGRYPNPTVQISGDEIGDVQGPGGIWSAPFFTQEIVTRGKRQLNREAALREVDQATLMFLAQRFVLITAVRQQYFDTLALQRRIEVLGELVQIAEKSVENTKKLVKAGQAAELDLVQLEVEFHRIQADHEAALREMPGAFRRLASMTGIADLPVAPLAGTLDTPLPDYDLDAVSRMVRDSHPEVKHARVGVDRAVLLLRRAEVERVPNVTLGAGFMRQNQNRSNDWGISVSLPVPLWNRNQGNIRSARADLGSAQQEIKRIELELIDRLASAHREYASARQRAERYRTAVLPRVRKAYEESLKAFQGGQFEYLKVLQAQRAMGEANLEYLKSAGEAWKSASLLAGLLLEEQWPMLPR